MAEDPKGKSVLKTPTVVIVLLMLQGCAAIVVGTAVGAVTTVAVETVKVPFKVTGAVIDVVPMMRTISLYIESLRTGQSDRSADALHRHI